MFAARRGMSVLASALVAIVSFCFCFGCQTGSKGPITVPLEFRPHDERSASGEVSSTLSRSDAKVHLKAVTDHRGNPEQIGINNRGKQPIPIHYSGKPPGQFIHDALELELKKLGVALADAAEGPDRIISIELNRFWVEESKLYLAEVRANVEVRDETGVSLWRGSIGGGGRNTGKSMKVANYQETISDATRHMIMGLLASPGFRKAFSR